MVDTSVADIIRRGRAAAIHPQAAGEQAPTCVVVDETAALLDHATSAEDELAVADAEVRHVVDRLVAAEAENARLRAELDAAESAVTDLLGELESAHVAGYTSPPSVWW